MTAAEDDAIYFNLGIIGLDESTGLLTIAVSGNRHCPGPCPTTTMTLAALDDDADQRRGLPPSASLTLQPADTVFSQSVQLPVRGKPSLYPFDTYTIWLGAGGVIKDADGTVVEMSSRHAGWAGPDPAEPHRGHGDAATGGDRSPRRALGDGPVCLPEPCSR